MSEIIQIELASTTQYGRKIVELPNDEDNPFLAISDLLAKEISVAVLASVIEKHGVCTYDKYGRFGFTDEEGKTRALYLLEIYYEWESTPPEERSLEDPRSPIEQWGCCSDNEYAHFGWTKKDILNFDNIEVIRALGLEEGKTNLSFKTKPVEHLNHDPDLQQKANDIASKITKETGRKPTKGEVAKMLLTEVDGISVETIERRIRKKW